jgi:hypothetical protein
MSDPFPLVELPIIDLTIRMFVEPRLEGDQALLYKINSDEALSKNERLYNLGVGEKDLASADKFAAILEKEGVEVAYKPGKLKLIPALAKSDSFMMELLDHDDERIRDLAQARLDVKSTIDETRSARLGAMSARGKLTIYLHYCGAHTRRWSGGDGVNFQNTGRRSELRRAIRAPAGYLLACPDQSQGECRILNWFAGEGEVIGRFRRGEDPYLPMASRLYGRAIDDPKAPERAFGKEVELAGLGPDTLVLTDRGTRPITTVQPHDRLWDGVEWVTHQGLLHQGSRTAINMAGLWLTPDHSVLCGSTWRVAEDVQGRTLSLALATGLASLPYPATSWGQPTGLIGEPLQSSKRKMMTYDLAFAGPRNRFTVVTPAGAFIVHNCGFGMGGERLASRLVAKGMTCEPGFPEFAVRTYRATHPNVVVQWREGDRILLALSGGLETSWGPGGFLKVRNRRIYHPNGTWLDYSRLRWEEGEWRLYERGGAHRKMYGAKLVENVVQWLSRIVTAEAMVEFDRWRLPVVGMAHDDVWLLIHKDEAETTKDAIVKVMSRTPKWAPGLPLAAECKMGETYGG